MKHLFIVNPAAGKAGNENELLDQIQELDLDCEVVHTQRQEEACEIARAAAQRGEPLRIYACGGDGTLNEVINGAAGFDHVAVTNVPLGTGNDFLKIFGSENKEKFSQLEELSRGPQVALDLMECNGKLGVDIFCAGVDARIAADVHKYRRLPLVRGIGAYTSRWWPMSYLKVSAARPRWRRESMPTRVRLPLYACAMAAITAAALCPWGTTSPTTASWRCWWCPRSAAGPSSAWWESTPRAAIVSTRI